jgi:hypothetical protein
VLTPNPGMNIPKSLFSFNFPFFLNIRTINLNSRE